MSMNETPSRLQAFVYITVEHAPVYRAVMRCFMDAREAFTLHLRPAEVTAALGSIVHANEPAPNVESALQQLCQWGNLERHPDTADAC